LSGAPAHIVVRAATEEDVDAIHGLVRELAETTGPVDKFRSTPEQYLRHGFSDRPMFEALVADSDAGIVGVALYFYTFSSWRGEPGLYLQDLVVTAKARGFGLGEKLLGELVRTAREHHATHLRLAVDSNNTAAMRFYERCGLSNVESDYIYEIEGRDFFGLGVAT
jgi:ribosomal protein S18 acetylase RimI-like enzyme